jgi:hypothetical protein
MQMRDSKLRIFSLLSLMATMSGCATHSMKGIVEASDMTVRGRVLSTVEVGVFVGDVEVTWYSYVIEQHLQPGSRIVVVGDRNDCPVADDINAIYDLHLMRRITKFAIRNEADQRLMSELFIARCERVDVP